jgi:pimeloyl-ACP methyl ester carboxylesterase
MSTPEHILGGTQAAPIHAVRAGKGQALVLLHGNGQSWHEFAHVLPDFADRFDTIAIDMPGQGDSVRQDTRLSIEAHAEQIGDFLRALGIGKAIVAGNSIGAFIAAGLAADSALVGRAVLIEAQLRSRDWWLAAWPMVEQLFAIPTQSREQVQARRIAPVSDAELARWNIDRNKAGTWSLLNAMAAIRDHDFPAALARVKVPTLLMFGAKGPAAETADAFKAAIPHAERVDVEEAGHFIVADRPRTFVQHIMDFAEKP